MKRTLLYNPTYLILSLILINILSCFVSLRLDLTSNKKYSLSPVSKTTLQQLNQDITVTLYLSDNLTPDRFKLARDFRNLLKEYQTLSKRPFNIQTVTPDTREKEMQAFQNGIKPFSQEIT